MGIPADSTCNERKVVGGGEGGGEGVGGFGPSVWSLLRPLAE